MSERQTGPVDGRSAASRTSATPERDPHKLYKKYRSDMAEFLVKSLALMNDAIGPEVGYEEGHPSSAADLERDPFVAIQLQARLLMKKARLHVAAVLTANHNSNLHSLSVQMRPALECAGQVVMVFHNLFISRRPDPDSIAQYLNADYYQTMQRLTRGQLGHDYLLKAIASADPLDPPRKAKRFNESDTVKSLEGGPDWYSFLSNHFHHRNVDALRGPSYLGGVTSNNTAVDQLAFAEFLGYLTHQILVMISHAALSPTTNLETDPFLAKVFALIADRRSTTEAHRNALAAVSPQPNQVAPD